MPADNKMTVVFVLGSPGAGKGTLSKRFADEFGYYHLSVGDYLRELCDLSKEQSQQSLGGLSQHELQASLKTRTLIPASTIVSIVHQKLEQERANRYNSFLIDGFPRSDDAAEAFDREVCKPSLVLLFDCGEKVAKARFLARNRELGDDEAMFARRYAEFEANNQLITERYAAQLRLVNTGGDTEMSYQRLKEQAKGIATGL